MEDDNLSLNRIIQAMHNQTKINKKEIIKKYKISPKRKACMVIPLCRMVPMPIVRPTFKIDILKME
jgi:hypothetical protein